MSRTHENGGEGSEEVNGCGRDWEGMDESGRK